jgi:hypothetical protein
VSNLGWVILGFYIGFGTAVLVIVYLAARYLPKDSAVVLAALAERFAAKEETP